MSDLVQLTKDNGIAIITINNPPVNALSPGVPEGIAAAIEQIDKDESVKAAVLIGGGKTFVAGADIKEFGKITSGKPGAGIELTDSSLENRGLPQARRHGYSRQRFWRRPRTCHVWPLPRRCARRASRPAGSKARPYSRSGRNAAIAAPRGRCQSRRNVRRRQSDQGR